MAKSASGNRRSELTPEDWTDKDAVTNKMRADKAELLLKKPPSLAHDEYWEDDLSVAVVDLLTDVMHLCRREQVLFEDCLRRATGHFSAEVEEERRLEHG